MWREMVIKLLWVQTRKDKVGKGRYIIRLQFLTQVIEGTLIVVAVKIPTDGSTINVL